MTGRKRWPNEAEWAREESIAAARKGLAAARKVPREGTAAAALVDLVDTLHEIIHILTSVGPGSTNEKPAGMLAA